MASWALFVPPLPACRPESARLAPRPRRLAQFPQRRDGRGLSLSSLTSREDLASLPCLEDQCWDFCSSVYSCRFPKPPPLIGAFGMQDASSDRARFDSDHIPHRLAHIGGTSADQLAKSLGFMLRCFCLHRRFFSGAFRVPFGTCSRHVLSQGVCGKVICLRLGGRHRRSSGALPCSSANVGSSGSACRTSLGWGKGRSRQVLVVCQGSSASDPGGVAQLRRRVCVCVCGV